MKKLSLLIIISLTILSVFFCQNETGETSNANSNTKIETVQNFDDKVQNQEPLIKPSFRRRSESTEGNETDLKMSTSYAIPEPNTEKSIIKNPFYQEKSTQKFAILKGKTTTIYGKEGTKITINSNDFIYESNGKLVEESIQIELQEYYKLSDILKANLITRTKDKILETGGMIHLSAFADGETWRLKDGKTVEIDFPFGTV